MFRQYMYPYQQYNQRGLLLPFIGGAILGGLGGWVIANNNQYPMYYPYYQPYYPYQYPYYSNGYYPYQ